MAPVPTELKLQTRIDVQCARCSHLGTIVRTTFPVLGVTVDYLGHPLPVVDVRAGEFDIEAECERCHQVIRWRGAPTTHDFPDDAYPPTNAELHAAAARATATVRAEREATLDTSDGKPQEPDRGGTPLVTSGPASDFPADPDAEHHHGA